MAKKNYPRYQIDALSKNIYDELVQDYKQFNTQVDDFNDNIINTFLEENPILKEFAERVGRSMVIAFIKNKCARTIKEKATIPSFEKIRGTLTEYILTTNSELDENIAKTKEYFIEKLIW